MNHFTFKVSTHTDHLHLLPAFQPLPASNALTIRVTAHVPPLSVVLPELYYPFQTFDFTSSGLISNTTLLGQVSPMFYDLSNTQIHHCYDFHLLMQSSVHLTHNTENP